MPEPEPRDEARHDRPQAGDRSAASRARPPRAAGSATPHAERQGKSEPRAAGGKKSYAKREGDPKAYPKRDGDRKPYPKQVGERKPYAKQEGGRKSYPKQEGGRKPYPKQEGDRSYSKEDGDRGPYRKRDTDGKPYGRQAGDQRPYAKPGSDRKPYPKQDGDRKPYPSREADRKPYARREGGTTPYPRDADRTPYSARDGERKSYAPRRSDAKPYPQRGGDRKQHPPREGDRTPHSHEGDRPPYSRRDGDRKPYSGDGDRKPYPRGADGGGRGRPTRGGVDRPDRAARPVDLRPERPRHDDPVIPEEVTARDLHPSARNELKTLSKENADWVARHLAMAAQLIDEDPELAHQHALSASRRAGRIAVVRETLAITAYATGDYPLALRELRTYRRISGRDDQIALMVDSERGVGRPDRALEVGRAVDRAALSVPERVELAIAMSGARLDLGQPDRALAELEIPEFDPDRAFEWSPSLFAARATVLEELDRDEEAREWHRRAIVAADALDEASGDADREVVIVEEVVEELSDDDDAPGSVDNPSAAGVDHDAAAMGGGDPAAVEDEAAVEHEAAEILLEVRVDDADAEGGV